MRNNKRYLQFLVIAITIFLLAQVLSGFALAWPETATITVDGQELKLREPAVVQDGCVIAPVRAVAEALQARTTWIGATGEVMISNQQTTIKLIVGSYLPPAHGGSSLKD